MLCHSYLYFGIHYFLKNIKVHFIAHKHFYSVYLRHEFLALRHNVFIFIAFLTTKFTVKARNASILILTPREMYWTWPHLLHVVRRRYCAWIECWIWSNLGHSQMQSKSYLAFDKVSFLKHNEWMQFQSK